MISADTPDHVGNLHYSKQHYALSAHFTLKHGAYSLTPSIPAPRKDGPVMIVHADGSIDSYGIFEREKPLSELAPPLVIIERPPVPVAPV